jgi:hypothetical protein
LTGTSKRNTAQKLGIPRLSHLRATVPDGVEATVPDGIEATVPDGIER